MAYDARPRLSCSLCDSEALRSLVSLAATPLANELVKEPGKTQDRFPLDLLSCARCGHVQLGAIVDPRRLFSDYVYVSGTSPVFREHFERYARKVTEELKPGFVVDIGSNDGTLLKSFKELGVRVLGIEPAREIARIAESEGVPTLSGFFEQDMAVRVLERHGHADVIVANNVFAHVPSPFDFAWAVKYLLSRQGVFIFEVSYLVDVLDSLLFDTIYHEHMDYHSVGPLVRMFARLGMELYRVERVSTHGGSIRCYVSAEGGMRPVERSVGEHLRLEEAAGLERRETYQLFKARIHEQTHRLHETLRLFTDTGRTVIGYGAPAKLTTLMYEMGIRKDQIAYVVDDSPWKQGLYTPGLHIPILPTSTFEKDLPGAVVIFAWNFAASIVCKHHWYLEHGGEFIAPLPVLRSWRLES